MTFYASREFQIFFFIQLFILFHTSAASILFLLIFSVIMSITQTHTYGYFDRTLQFLFANFFHSHECKINRQWWNNNNKINTSFSYVLNDCFF